MSRIDLLRIDTEASGKPFRPRLAVPIGDPSGIGPEVVLKALANPALSDACELTIVGSSTLLQRLYDHLMQQHADWQNTRCIANPQELSVMEIEGLEDLEKDCIWGRELAASGELSFRYLETAIAETLAGRFHGIVTAPIAKSAWKAAGHYYPGQTELLAERAGVNRFGMLFVARSPHTQWALRTLLATTHIPLRNVPDVISPNLLSLKLELLIDCLHRDFGIQHPRIAIAGLNPHSGEQGQLGSEERQILIPWLQTVRDRFPHVQLDGPVPPDTLWVSPGQAWFGTASVNAYDAYLALYHDQGLIPVKLMAFDRAVNTTIGLPFVRTSPDHGTAFDIAGQGIANSTSMVAAIQLAIELATQRVEVRVGRDDKT